jgi:uncharacterized protein (DUF1330 family)
MAIYVLASITVNDRDSYEEYKQKVPSIIAQYGGRYLVRGAKGEIIEGNWEDKRSILLEFPNRNTFETWYNSEEYKELKELRQSIANSNIVLFEGV